MNSFDVVKISKALSDANRVSILEILSKGEEIGCNLLEQFKITQPTFSHHMKILCDCGLVNDRRDEKCHYYSIQREALQYYLEFISSLRGK